MTEAELDEKIQALCKDMNIWSYHPKLSYGSERGWPDRSYIGRRGALFRELKTGSGVLTHDQKYVGYRMEAAGLNWSVWRPVHLESGRIEQELKEIA